MNVFWVLTIFVLLLSSAAWSAPLRTTYQAKIVKPDGYPLESANVNFKFTILDPAGSCILFSEIFSAVNMQNSGGLISMSLGSGIADFNASGTATFASVFNNSSSNLNCLSGSTYTPTAHDVRKVVMQFNDGGGWQTLPSLSINAVPYAIYSFDSQRLGGVSASSYVRHSTVPTCRASEALTYNNGSFACIGGGSLSSVTASDVTNALGYTPVNVSTVQTSFTTVTGSLSTLASSYTVLASTMGDLSASLTALAATPSLQSLNGSTSSTQSFAISFSGSTPQINTLNGVHTLSIPLASVGTTTAGLISNSDYVNFSNKLNATNPAVVAALGYTPANSATVNAAANTYVVKANNLSDLADLPSARNNLGLGSFATANSVDLGSASATGIIAEARLANSGVIAGTYTKLTVDGKGRVTSSSSLASIDITTALGFMPVASGSIISSQWLTSGTTINYMNGNVGIGTTSPTAGFEVKDSTGSGDYSSVIKVSADRSNNERAILETYTENSTNADNFIFLTSKVSSSSVTAITSPPSVLIQTFRDAPMIAGDYFGAFLARATDTTGSHSRDAAGLRFMTPDGTKTQFRLSLNSLLGAAGGGIGRSVLTGTSDGNVGIDMTAPTAKLQIAAGSNSLAPVKLMSGTLLTSPQSGTIEYDGFNFYVTDGTNSRRSIATVQTQGTFENTNAISNPSGNISLVPNNLSGSVIVSATTESTNSNTGALVVKGGAGISGNLYVSGSILTSANIQGASITAINGIVTPVINGTANLAINPTGGNVGIGTSSPADRLHVVGNAILGSIPNYSSGGSGLYISNEAGDPYNFFRIDGYANDLGIVASSLSGATSGSTISFRTSSPGAGINGATRLRIAENGNIGIGTTAPQATVDVAGAGQLWIRQSNGGGLSSSAGAGLKLESVSFGGNIQAYNYASGTATNLVLQASGGNVGVGTTTPSVRLEVNSQAIGQSGIKLTQLNSNSTTAGSSNNALSLNSSGEIIWSAVNPSATTPQYTPFLAINKNFEFLDLPNGPTSLPNYAGTSGDIVNWDITYIDVNSGQDPTTRDTEAKNLLDYMGIGQSTLHFHSSFKIMKLTRKNSTPGGSYTFYIPQQHVPTGFGSTYMVYTKVVGTTRFNYSENSASWAQTVVNYPASGNPGSYTHIDYVETTTGSTGDTFYIALPVIVPGLWPSGVRHGVLPSTTGGEGDSLGNVNWKDNGNATYFNRGNVGVGITTPAAKLHIENSGSIGTPPVVGNSHLSLTSGAAGLHFDTNQIVAKNANLNIQSSAGVASLIRLWTDEQLRMIVDATGNVGIGTAAPDFLLSVSGGAVMTGGWRKTMKLEAPHPTIQFKGGAQDFKSAWIAYDDATSSNGLSFWINGSSSDMTTDSLRAMTMRSSGQIGVGTASPSEKFHIVGNLRVQGSTDCTLGNGAGGTSCSSDARLKDNVKPITKALDKVLSLRGVKFDWNHQSQSYGRKDIGVIAQDVEKVFPTAVITDKITTFKKVDYAVLIAPVIQALKEFYQLFGIEQARNQRQDRQIASLSEKTSVLEAENLELKKKVQQLESVKIYLCQKDPNANFCD